MKKGSLNQLYLKNYIRYGLLITRTSTYHQQANSVVERLNRTLGASLIDHNQMDWYLKLSQIFYEL